VSVQKIEQKIEALVGIAVADIVGCSVDGLQLAAGDAFLHLEIGARVTDFLTAGGHDQRGCANRHQVIEKIMRAHMGDEARNECGVIRSRLTNELLHQCRISPPVETLVNGFRQKPAQAAFRDFGNPGGRMALLEPRR